MEFLKDPPYTSRIHTYVVEVKVKDTIVKMVFSMMPSTPANEYEIQQEAIQRINRSGLFKFKDADGEFIGFDEADVSIVEDIIYSPRGSANGECVQVCRPKIGETSKGYFKRLHESALSRASAAKEDRKNTKDKVKQAGIDQYNQEKKAEQDAIAAGNPLPHKEKPSKVAIDVILERVVEHFSEPRKMTEASKTLDLTYQKTRYALMLVKDKGFKGDKYELVESVVDENKAFQLIKKV